MTPLNSRLQLALLNHKKGRNLLEKGFTLVELMIVIVIVGVLSAVALPNFLSQKDKAVATEATSQMTAILKEAFAEYQFDNDADVALKAAEASALNQDSDIFTYTPEKGTADDSGVGTIQVTATSTDIADIISCVNLATGEMDTSRPGGQASCV